MSVGRSRNFRVYNDIYRVGVGFRIGDTFFGLHTAGFALAVLAGTLFAAGGLVKVWPAAALVVGVTGAVVLTWLSIAVYRLNAMGRYAAGSDKDQLRLQETTQIKLLWEQTRHPLYRNFLTPDDDGGPVFRNY